MLALSIAMDAQRSGREADLMRGIGTNVNLKLRTGMKRLQLTSKGSRPAVWRLTVYCQNDQLTRYARLIRSPTATASKISMRSIGIKISLGTWSR